MTRISIFLATMLLTISSGLAQPDLINYQSVVRNAQGEIIPNQNVAFRFSIREASANGTVVYEETHTATTSDQGLVNLRIGAGTSSQNFSTIDWGSNDYFLQVEFDPAGSSNYTEMGTSQLVSVPFAMHARTAAEVDDADADPTNELQDLSINGQTLSISGGNSVSLPGGGDESATAKAWVNFPIVGTPNLTFDAYNVTNTSVSGTGIRVINLQPGLFSTPANNPACTCTINNDLAPGFCTVIFGSSPSQVTVRTYNSSGVLADKEFSLVIFGN